MRAQHKTSKKSSSSRNVNRASGSYANEVYNDDGSDDENAISLAAIKNKYKKGHIPTKGMRIETNEFIDNFRESMNGKDKLILDLFLLSVSNIYSSDEEGSDIEPTRTKKQTKKIMKDSDESDSRSDRSAHETGGDDDGQENDSSD